MSDRYVDNGRVVSAAEASPGFSWIRLFTLLFTGALLFALNPANDPYTIKALLRNRVKLDPINLSSRQIKPSRPLSHDQTLNFGFFAVEHGISRVRIVGLGTECKCYYNLHPTICHSILAKSVQRTIKSTNNDQLIPANKVLYILLSILTIGTLYLQSCQNKRAAVTSKSILGALLSNTILFPANLVDYFYICFFSSPTILLNALEYMQELLPVQEKKSLFYHNYKSTSKSGFSILNFVSNEKTRFTHLDTATLHILVATMVMIVLAAGLATMTRVVLLRKQRYDRGGRWDLINAAALGFCTTMQAPIKVLSSTTVASFTLALLSSTFDVLTSANTEFSLQSIINGHNYHATTTISATSLSWIFFLYKLLTVGIIDALEWLAAYYGGYIIGEYQLDHLTTAVQFKYIVESSVQQFVNNVMSGFGAYQ